MLNDRSVYTQDGSVTSRMLRPMPWHPYLPGHRYAQGQAVVTPPKGRPRSKGRTGGGWRRVRDKCKAAAARGTPCVWCLQPIDLALPYPHPHSFAADHVIELVVGGAPYEVAPMHKVCNEDKEVQRRAAERMMRAQMNKNSSRIW